MEMQGRDLEKRLMPVRWRVLRNTNTVIKSGRPATPPAEKKQRPELALYSKDEILALTRKVYLSVLSDVAAKDKSSASLLVRIRCRHTTQKLCWLTAASGLATLLQQKAQSAGLQALSFPFHGIRLGRVAVSEVE